MSSYVNAQTSVTHFTQVQLVLPFDIQITLHGQVLVILLVVMEVVVLLVVVVEGGLTSCCDFAVTVTLTWWIHCYVIWWNWEVDCSEPTLFWQNILSMLYFWQPVRLLPVQYILRESADCIIQRPEYLWFHCSPFEGELAGYIGTLSNWAAHNPSFQPRTETQCGDVSNQERSLDLIPTQFSLCFLRTKFSPS